MAAPARVETVIGVRVIALCGESVLIQGVEAGLRDRGGVETVLIDTSWPDAVQALDKLSPQIIVFDLTPSSFSCVVTFLQTHTDVVLIGLDTGRDQALFLSGERRRLETVADLMQVIQAGTQVGKGTNDEEEQPHPN